MESLAFGVPTVTTSLAGFGRWVSEHYKKPHPSIEIIERNDFNYDDVISAIEAKMVEICKLTPQKMLDYRNNAREVSEVALWENQIQFYKQAYSQALEKLIENWDNYESLQMTRKV